MIVKLKFNIEKNDKININMSSLLHGFLIENLENNFAEEMHQMSMRPYSQNISVENSNWYWNINTLNAVAYKKIISNIENLKKVYLTHNKNEIVIKNKEIIKSDYNKLFYKNYIEEKNSRYIDIEFLTPTAFKKDNRYVNYPDKKLIFSNLIKRYDLFSEITKIYDEKLIKEFNDKSEIVKYNLRSTYFYLEGIKIPSFKGRITLKIGGSNVLVNLSNMLLEFGEFSGVGIKTALGMGALKKYDNRRYSQ